MDIEKAFEAEIAAFKEKTAISELVKIKHQFGGADIYRPTALSTYRMDAINKSIVKGGTGYHVDLLIHVARDANGKPMFKESHRTTLLKQIEATVLKDIAADLLETVMKTGVDDPND